MKIDFESLKNKLQGLNGLDFIEVEREARLDGDVMPMISFSTNFQIRLAARALETNPHELEKLPLNQYVQIANTVSNFFFTDSDEDSTETPDEKNQKTQSEKSNE